MLHCASKKLCSNTCFESTLNSDIGTGTDLRAFKYGYILKHWVSHIGE